MPEGHTIHRIAGRHRDLFGGSAVRAWSPQGRFADGAADLDGTLLEDVEAYGKHLHYRFASDRILHVHLGLIGRFATHRGEVPEPTPGTRLAIANEDGAAYLSGPMTCALVTPEEAAATAAKLGPDPLRSRGGARAFAAALARRRIPIGAALLDQAVVAGIGNVYRAEILFLCGIHPGTPANRLVADDVDCLWRTIGNQLRRGLRMGRIVTVSLGDVGARSREALADDDRRYAYHRDGLACHRCGTEIRRMEIAGRATWWCPSCQPAAVVARPASGRE